MVNRSTLTLFLISFSCPLVAGNAASRAAKQSSISDVIVSDATSSTRAIPMIRINNNTTDFITVAYHIVDAPSTNLLMYTTEINPHDNKMLPYYFAEDGTPCVYIANRLREEVFRSPTDQCSQVSVTSDERGSLLALFE